MSNDDDVALCVWRVARGGTGGTGVQCILWSYSLMRAAFVSQSSSKSLFVDLVDLPVLLVFRSLAT